MFVNRFFRRYWRYLLICACAVITTAPSCGKGGRNGGGSQLLIITTIASLNISDVGAAITWRTNRPADSQVEYGVTTSYGNVVSLKTLDTSHQLTVFGLTPNTLYHYRVKSKDEAGNLATSGDLTFTTAKSGNTQDLFSLAPYTGPFGEEQARILFDRFGFGATPQQVDQAVTDGIELTITKLTTWQSEGNLGAIVYDWGCDNWLRGDGLDNPGACSGDQYDFKHQTYADSRLIYFLHSPNQYFYKLILFLHDERLAGSDLDADKFFYRHVYVEHWNMLLSAAQSGDYKQFMRGWMKDSLGHVFWQDGEDNRKAHPNENFAREFWELGTVGTIDLNGNPVYTDFDIANAARVHTGYSRVQGTDAKGPYQEGVYREADHATGAFDIFVGTPYFARVSTQEQLLQATFNHPRTAEHLAEDLWKEFINPGKDANAIRTLAQVIRDSNYNLTPVMRVIMRSKAFYAPGSKESLIKQPIELVIGLLRTFPGYTTANINNGDDYTVLMKHTGDLGQAFFAPNTIFGWDEKVLAGASYIKAWRDASNQLLTKTVGFVSDYFAKYDLAAPNGPFLSGVSTTGQLVDRLSRWFNVPLNSTQRGFLEQYLNTQPTLNGGTVVPQDSPFFSASITAKRERLKGAIAILVNQPSYRTK